ncbi:LacI family transcriptional regulator, partial [Klebsiella pneumoniae]
RAPVGLACRRRGGPAADPGAVESVGGEALAAGR